MAEFIDVFPRTSAGKARHLGPCVEHEVDQVGRCRVDELFRSRFRRGEEGPLPVEEAEVLVGTVVRVADRDDVHDGEPENSIRVIQCEAVGAAGPAIVSHDTEPAVAQMLHDLELVTADRVHAVGLVIGRTGRLAAVAVPTQVGGDDGVALCEAECYPVPHQMRFRNTVQERQRRSVAATASVDRRIRGSDVELFETVEHVHEPSRDSRTVLCRRTSAVGADDESLLPLTGEIAGGVGPSAAGYVTTVVRATQ